MLISCAAYQDGIYGMNFEHMPEPKWQRLRYYNHPTALTQGIDEAYAGIDEAYALQR
jgi:hypothetical protein